MNKDVFGVGAWDSVFYFFYFAIIGVYIIFMPKVLIELEYSTVEVGIVYAAAPFMRFLLPFVFKHYIDLSKNQYHENQHTIPINSANIHE